MRNNYTKPVFVTTSRYLIPKKYFDDEKYFIEIVVFNPEHRPVIQLSAEVYTLIKKSITGKKEYRVYLK